MHKQCQVVMLPTNQKAQLILWEDGKLYTADMAGVTHFNHIEGGPHKCQHLYILSDDKIEDRDYCIMLDDLGNIFSEPAQYIAGTNHVLNKNLRKIIASTDTSLELLQLSPEFLKVFCEKQPKEVLVKYFSDEKLQLPIIKNNQISIKEVKQTYTREEVQPLVDALIKAQKLLKESADAGYYSLSALQENGGEGFKFMTKALEAFL